MIHEFGREHFLLRKEATNDLLQKRVHTDHKIYSSFLKRMQIVAENLKRGIFCDYTFFPMKLIKLSQRCFFFQKNKFSSQLKMLSYEMNFAPMKMLLWIHLWIQNHGSYFTKLLIGIDFFLGQLAQQALWLQCGCFGGLLCSCHCGHVGRVSHLVQGRTETFQIKKTAQERICCIMYCWCVCS